MKKRFYLHQLIKFLIFILFFFSCKSQHHNSSASNLIECLDLVIQRFDLSSQNASTSLLKTINPKENRFAKYFNRYQISYKENHFVFDILEIDEAGVKDYYVRDRTPSKLSMSRGVLSQDKFNEFASCQRVSFIKPLLSETQTKSIISLSATQYSYLKNLHLDHQIIGTNYNSTIEFAQSLLGERESHKKIDLPYQLNRESLLKIKARFIFTSGENIEIEESIIHFIKEKNKNILFIKDLSYLENHPMAKIEWLEVYEFILEDLMTLDQSSTRDFFTKKQFSCYDILIATLKEDLKGNVNAKTVFHRGIIGKFFGDQWSLPLKDHYWTTLLSELGIGFNHLYDFLRHERISDGFEKERKKTYQLMNNEQMIKIFKQTRPNFWLIPQFQSSLKQLKNENKHYQYFGDKSRVVYSINLREDLLRKKEKISEGQVNELSFLFLNMSWPGLYEDLLKKLHKDIFLHYQKSIKEKQMDCDFEENFLRFNRVN